MRAVEATGNAIEDAIECARVFGLPVPNLPRHMIGFPMFFLHTEPVREGDWIVSDPYPRIVSPHVGEGEL